MKGTQCVLFFLLLKASTALDIQDNYCAVKFLMKGLWRVSSEESLMSNYPKMYYREIKGKSKTDNVSYREG